MKYLIDTDTVTHSVDRNSSFHRTVINKIAGFSDDDEAYISVLTQYEKEFGVANVESEEDKTKFREALELLLKKFEIFPISEEGAQVFGEIKARLKKETGLSKKILSRHNVDLIIASTAVVNNAVLVARDKIYKKIKNLYPELQLENWLPDEGIQTAKK